MTAVKRLAAYRARAEKYRANQPQHANGHYGTWRAWASKPIGQKSCKRFGTYDNGAGMWLDSHDQAPGFRFIKKVGELLNLRYTGWYTDHDFGETAIGTVSVLRLGKWAYAVPGYTHSSMDTDTLRFDDAQRILAKDAWSESGDKFAVTEAFEDIMRDVAHTADHLAQKYAEDCKEGETEALAESRIEQFRDDIATAREAIKELIQEIKQHGKAFSPAICNTLRKKIEEEWQCVQNWREGIKELTDSPHMVHEYK